MDQELIELKKESKAQNKNSKKYKDLQNKEKIMDLLEKKVKILESKYGGEEIDEDEIKDNRTALEKLDDILNKNIEDSTQERKLNEKEKNKINEWDERKKEQDEKLEEIGKGVQQLKHLAEMAGIGINKLGERTKMTERNIDITHKKVKTQNEKLSELVNKIRSSDKICCDIALILILLGLICFLYSIIKHKYLK